MIINNNLSALNTHRQMGQVSGAAQNSMEKLSSGQRINKGADDAAGLSISEKMRNQIRGLEQAQRNAQDGVSLIQTADGALSEVHEILQRMRELAVQASNDTNGDDERTAIESELNELNGEIKNIKDTTKFNGISLLGGQAGTASTGSGSGAVTTYALKIQNGADANQMMSLDLSTNGINLTDIEFAASGSGSLKVTDSSTGSGSGAVTTSASENATNLIATIDAKIKAVSIGRSTLGAYQNRLEHTTNNLGSAAENLTAAESRVRDVDMAKEMMEFTKNNILTQASQAMLAQANQQPQAVLQLLR
ncbi:flagellin [Chryseomicrobium palamuruense]|uniref:Flagellin n=1 Tax=Chryseomicrobium palamuruense TaxID=682973 RepID=A0ABV8UVA6_9BACL